MLPALSSQGEERTWDLPMNVHKRVEEEGPCHWCPTMEAVAKVVAVCLASAALLTGGGRTRTISNMSKRIVMQNILTVGLPMVTAIAARGVEDEVTMAMATIMCSAGDVAILKINFVPEREG